MSKVCSHCGSTEVVVHNDVGMATCRECGFAGSVLSFDDMNIAYWLSGDLHALAELFVVRQFNSLCGIVEGVEPVSWYSVLIPDITFKSRQEAVSVSFNVLKREASYRDFYKFMEEMRKYNTLAGKDNNVPAKESESDTGSAKCEYCGKTYRKKKKAQRFCSIKCKDSWWNRERAVDRDYLHPQCEDNFNGEC